MATTSISVGPAPLDLKLYAGDAFAVQFVFVDKATGAPWPATGTWAAQVRSPAAAPDIVIDFTIDASDQANGKIIASLTGEEVRALLNATAAVWDLEQIPTGGLAPRTWYRGKITAVQDVTRV